MKISNSNYSQNFCGRILLKGNYPDAIKNALLDNPHIKKLENLKEDVSLTIIHKINSINEQTKYLRDEEDYKIFLKKEKKCSNCFEKIIDKLFNHKKSLTKGFHSFDTTIAVVSKYVDDEWLKRLGFYI